MAFLAAVTVAIAAGCILALVALQHRPSADLQHWSRTVPVLGGHEPQTHAWGRFHARFYPMTLVLIAFEMEMMFMYPWAIVYRSLGVKALVEMGVFLTILSLGILYLWRERGLSWQ
jgi:NADH-quinone oxidoreductase subunit A